MSVCTYDFIYMYMCPHTHTEITYLQMLKKYLNRPEFFTDKNSNGIFIDKSRIKQNHNLSKQYLLHKA